MKTILMPEEIAKQAENKDGIANIRLINKLFRAQDESNLWPICGRFNATERAIRIARNVYAKANGATYGLEYAYLLDGLISGIVNKQN